MAFRVLLLMSVQCELCGFFLFFHGLKQGQQPNDIMFIFFYFFFIWKADFDINNKMSTKTVNPEGNLAN